MGTTALATEDPVWYVAYGSNLQGSRFGCYLAGGRPPGAARTYAGCRDPSPPRAAVGVALPGRLRFAGQSVVWGGGFAFYEAAGDGAVVGRGYLVTFGQLSDVVAQETRRPPGNDLEPEQVGVAGALTRSPTYDSVLQVGTRDGVPMLTLGAGRPPPVTAPSAGYLAVLLAGLAETRRWTVSARVDYLLAARGVRPTWTAAQVHELATGGRRRSGPRSRAAATPEAGADRGRCPAAWRPDLRPRPIGSLAPGRRRRRGAGWAEEEE